MNKFPIWWPLVGLCVMGLWASLAVGQGTPDAAPTMTLAQQRDQTIYAIGYASRHYDDLMTQAIAERQRIDEMRKALVELDTQIAAADRPTSGTLPR